MAHQASACSPVLPQPLSTTAESSVDSTHSIQLATEHATSSNYFSRSQLALALAVQKAKPAEMSTKDYCLQLRKNIRSHQGVVNNPSRYIDTCDFWKEQYTKLHQEKKALEDKVQYLQSMQSRRDHHGTPTLDNRDNSAPMQQDSMSYQDVEESLDTHQGDPSPTDGSMLRLSRHILQIGQQRNHLEKNIQESNLPNHLDNIAGSSQKLLILLDTALDDCTVPLWFLKCNDDTQTVSLLKQVMRQIISSFHYCIHALNELCLTILGRAKRYDMVYRLVMFFNKALDHLRTTCALQADNESADRRRTRRKRIKVEVEYAVNKYLSEALISITQTDWKVGKPGHSDILEGILFSIVVHTGRLVSNAVFNEHVAMSNRIGNISNVCPSVSYEAEGLEARYAIPILRAALGGSILRKELVARILSDQPANIDERNPQTSLPATDDHAHNLLVKARKRLQQTLLKTAVGGNGLDSLKLPPPPEEDQEIACEPSGCSEKYGAEWILENVWSLLGWELAI